MLWKNLAFVVAGAVTFALVFAASAAAVAIAGSVGAQLGTVGVVAAQAGMAGLLGALGGISLAAVKVSIATISGAIREARFHTTTVTHELHQANRVRMHELAHDAKHALLVGFIAGAVLAGAAAVLPTWVLVVLKGAVIFGLAFEALKALGNTVAFWLEHWRHGKALDRNDAEAVRRHRWERDEEVEELLINAVNLGVLGLLMHSLHEINAANVSEINTGVAMSSDEVAALAESFGELGEAAAVAAGEYREVRNAGGWLKRLRAILRDAPSKS